MGSTTTLAAMGVFQTELAANQVPLKLALPVVAAVTVMLKGGSELEATPSLTLSTMLEYVPVCVLAGVPESWPVAMLKLAQAGMFVIENDRLLPDGSVVVGVNEYPVPAATLVGGVPDMVGGEAETLTVTDRLALPPGPLQVSVKAVVVLSAPVFAVPLVCLLPDQPPEAVQLVAFADDQLSVAEPPLLMVVGLALRLTVGDAATLTVTD